MPPPSGGSGGGQGGGKPGRGAYLDVSSPWARGLLAFYALVENGGVSCCDSSGNAPPLALFPGTTWGSGLAGGLLATAASRGAYAALPAALQAPYPVTIASAQRILGSGTNALWGVNSSASFSSVYGFSRGSSTLFLQWLSGGTLKSTNTNITTSTGLDFVVSATITPVGATAYWNGVQSAASVTANSNPTYPGTSYLAIGDSPGNTSNPNALYYWMLILGRALSAAEHAAMFASPSAIWPLLATGPLRSWVFFQGTGALAGSSSGGLVLGGTAAPSVSYSPPAAGGLILGGTAAGSPIFVPPTIGGAIVGGTAAPSALFSPPPSGGAALGGAAVGSLAGSAAGMGAWRRGHKPERGAYLDIANPLARGLAGLWPLNEGDGVPFNPVTRTAAASNSMTWSAGPAPRRGTLLNAGGTAKSVQIPVAAGSPLDITGTQISFGAWVYPTVSNVYQTVILLTAGNTDTLRQYGLQLNANGTNFLYISMGGSAIIINNTTTLSVPWTVNAWNHVLVTYDGAHVTAYINGRQSASVAKTASISHIANSTLYFGYDGGVGSFGLNGYLDAPVVCNRCLTAAEALAIGGTPGGIWQLFAPGPLRTIYSGSGAPSFAGSSSGGAAAGGAAAPSVAYSPPAAGGAVAGGSAAPSARFSPPASGGAVVGGTAQGSAPGAFTAVASGGAAVGGTAAPSVVFAGASSGGAVAGGAAQGSSPGAFTAIASGGPAAGGLVFPAARFAGLSSGGMIVGGAAQGANPSAVVLTIREAVYAWLAGTPTIAAIVGTRIYFGQPSQLAAYPCLVIKVSDRKYGHNLAGADGTSRATVEIGALGLRKLDTIAAAEAVRDVAQGFRGTQSGVAIMRFLLDDEADDETAPPDGSDQWIYATTLEYRCDHRVPFPKSVTQTNV